MSSSSSSSVVAAWVSSQCHYLQTQRGNHAPFAATVPQVLAPAVERHLRSVIDDAVKVQARGRHATMTVDDVNLALALAKNEVVYGFSFSRPVRVTGFTGESDVQYVPEEEIELTDAVQALLPPAPIAPSFVAHWLAVAGAQPAIPQNPVGAYETDIMGVLGVPNFGAGPVNGVVIGGSMAAARVGGRAAVSQTQAAHAEMQHVMSQEMQLYYAKVVSAIKSCHDSQQRPVFRALAQDRGLQELLPYFSRFVQKMVANNLRDLRLLKAMMQTVECLLTNPFLHIELYLHQLMPAVLTCIVGKRLSASTAEDHWSLRDMAAGIVASITRK